MGSFHAVFGAVTVVVSAWNCVYTAIGLFPAIRRGVWNQVLPSFWRDTLTVLFALPLSVVACASGVWLLHGKPRGRRWTIVLACASILLTSVRIVYILLNPQQLGAEPAPGPLAACYTYLGFMTYWFIVVLVMHLPSVRRVYARTEQAAGTQR